MLITLQRYNYKLFTVDDTDLGEDGRVTDLLIELNVSEYGVNAPRLAKHGAERQRETDAEHPRLYLRKPTVTSLAARCDKVR